MAPFAEPLLAQRHDLLHHAKDRIADALGGRLELGEVDVLDLALTLDLARCLLRDDAEPPLHACQRGLDFEIAGGAVLVGEHAAHLGGREDVAEDDRIEGGGRHVLLRSSLAS